jgi:hypothetical protein
VVGEKLRTKGTALAIEGFKQAAEKLNADRYGKVGTGFSPYTGVSTYPGTKRGISTTVAPFDAEFWLCIRARL